MTSTITRARGRFTAFPAGYRWGRLTIVRDRRRGESAVDVKCECGREWALRVDNVDVTMSCGCLHADQLRKESDFLRLPDGTVGITIGDDRMATIDGLDLELIRSVSTSWRILRGHNGKTYVAASVGDTGKRRTVYMHRTIAGTPSGVETDHVDGDGLNNVRSNLRTANCSQNSANTGKPRRPGGAPPSSIYKGVSWSTHRRKWIAKITTSGSCRNLGGFTDEREAAVAYDLASIQAWGEFAQLNFVGVEA